MKKWLVGLLMFLFGMLASAVLFLVTSQPRGHSVELLPAPTPAPWIIQVDGSVNHPGVYRLPPESRVGEAITAAGGLKPDANQSQINLAARIKDGDKISIPSLEDQPESASFASPAKVVPLSSDPVATPGAIININQASLDELEKLPGIGVTRAQRIIEYREANNGFKSIEEIQEVNGIGPSIFDQLKDLITVD